MQILKFRSSFIVEVREMKGHKQEQMNNVSRVAKLQS